MASHIVSPPFGPATSPCESDAELEVDELDSDSEVEDAADTSQGISGHSATRSGERLPGHTLLPSARVENMVQSDASTTGNLTLSREAIFVLSIATEDFIKRFVQAGHREASAHRRTQINYLDMAATTQQYQEFMFLGDTIPCPIPLIDALVLRQEKEREQLEDNPALAPISPLTASWMPTPPMPGPYDYDPPKPKKNRTTNGRENKRSKKVATSNGHERPLSLSAQDFGPPELGDQIDATDSYADKGSSSTHMLYVNGTPPFEEPVDATFTHPPVDYPGVHSPPYQGDDDAHWSDSNSAYTTGTVRESAPAPPVSSLNPGRTIYSQTPDTRPQ